MEKGIKWLEKMKFDYESGHLEMGGFRSTIASSMTFRSHREAMAEVIGHGGADTILYMIGKEQAGDFFKLMKKTGSGTRGDAGPVMDSAMSLLNQYGYGNPSFEKLDLAGESVVILKESCMAYYYLQKKERPDGPVCSNFCGILSGFAELLTGKPYQVIETHCLARGDEHCRFSIKAEDIVKTKKGKK